jgi:hypothetical protein
MSIITPTSMQQTLTYIKVLQPKNNQDIRNKKKKEQKKSTELKTLK